MGMPYYAPSIKEQEAYEHCVRQGIRVSPRGIYNKPNQWLIEISTNGVDWKKSPKAYGRDEIWGKFYEICGFYHDKYNT